MDLSAHPAGSYIEITAPLTIDGVTASLVSGDLLFTVNKLNVTLPSTIFNIKVFDSSNVEIDSFNINYCIYSINNKFYIWQSNIKL